LILKLMTGFRNISIGHMTLSKLKKSNYDKWNIHIRELLGAWDVWDIIKTRYVELEIIGALTNATSEGTKREKIADKTILYIIYQVVDEIWFKKIIVRPFFAHITVRDNGLQKKNTEIPLNVHLEGYIMNMGCTFRVFRDCTYLHTICIRPKLENRTVHQKCLGTVHDRLSYNVVVHDPHQIKDLW
jgi:tryptophan 2,3-dioxygenase